MGTNVARRETHLESQAFRARHEVAREETFYILAGVVRPQSLPSAVSGAENNIVFYQVCIKHDRMIVCSILWYTNTGDGGINCKI